MNIQISKRIQNIPPYAFAEIDKQVSKLRAEGVKVVDFGVGDPSSPVPDFVIDELGKAAKARATDGYPSYIGTAKFREKCAEYMQRTYNVSLDFETEITSSIGSKEAIFNFPLGFVDAGDVVICPTPGYPPYRTGTKFAGGIPYFVPLLKENDFLIDFESIPSEICKKAKIIWINYPNSPTGATAPREWLEKLILWAKKNEIIIAADEGCYIDIWFKKKPVSILEIEKKGIVVFYSLSKRNNMTGYRVGFCAGDEEIISAFKLVKTNIDSGTPTFIQDAACVALDDDKHIAQMVEEYREKSEILLSAFAEAGLPRCESDATFYIWQKAPEGMSGLELAQKFISLGIVGTPGVAISDVTENGINPGENYMRFALVPTLEEVKDAAERIKQMGQF